MEDLEDTGKDSLGRRPGWHCVVLELWDRLWMCRGISGNLLVCEEAPDGVRKRLLGFFRVHQSLKGTNWAWLDHLDWQLMLVSSDAACACGHSDMHIHTAVWGLGERFSETFKINCLVQVLLIPINTCHKQRYPYIYNIEHKSKE